MSFLWRVYTTALAKHPYRTQILTSGMLWFGGDVLAQTISTRAGAAPLDTRRAGLNGGYGGVVNGILGHVWYRELDRMARRHFRSGSVGFVAAKVAADGIIFGPVHVAGYLGAMSLMSGRNVEETVKTVRDKFAEAYGVELLGWSLVQTVNFRFVPVAYHLLVVNCVTVVDAAFMSWWLNYGGGTSTSRMG